MHRPSRSLCKSNQDDKDTKWHKVRKNRSRNDYRPKRKANNATDRKRNQNGAYYLQSTSKNVPPQRVTPPSEIALRPGRADRIEEACAKEAGNE
jgi:hypothetical protein